MCPFYGVDSEKSKRRTKTAAGTLAPEWNQTFVYSPMKRPDINSHSLEITVYDYDRIGSGEYVGEVRNILYFCYPPYIHLYIHLYILQYTCTYVYSPDM